MKKYSFIAILTVALFFGSCSSEFLHRDPKGSSVMQSQYEKFPDALEGSIKGIYTQLYTDNSDDHDDFGLRSLDLQTDMLSGDIALTAYTYGWFQTDEWRMTYQRTGTYWMLFYGMLHNINNAIYTIKNAHDLVQHVAEYGFPSESKDYTFTDTEIALAQQYAQILALRAFSYSKLAMLYGPVPDDLKEGGYTISTYKTVPVYTEDNKDTPQGLSTLEEVFNRANLDFEEAIRYFEEFGDGVSRENKIIINLDVARALYAYTLLNEAPYWEVLNNSKYLEKMNLCLKNAEEVINTSHFTILPFDKLLTDGFNNVSTDSWMWGQDVTVETSGGLKSFFGQVDIHSYSYAWAGDTKAIDVDLWNAIPDWDSRKKWFVDKSEKKFPLCPSKKFFSASNPNSTDDDKLDREWLSDNVFMRIESVYLTAAEAARKLGQIDVAKNYLLAIVDNRVDANDETAMASYSDYKNNLNSSNLLKEIEYNWRVELWGEGYGLQTFLRLTKSKKRGANHSNESGTEVHDIDPQFLFSLPSSEITYNPNITD